MGARVLFDSSQIPGEIVDLLVVSGDVASGQARQLDALVAGWRMATQMLRTNRSAFAAEAAAREGIDPKTFAEYLDGLSFPSMQENRLLLDEKKSPLIQTAVTMSRTMARMGLLKAAVTNLDFVDPLPVTRAQR